MGRTLKRVPIDFDWPLNKEWHGFLNPYGSDECVYCDGSGYAPKAERFRKQWYGTAPFDPVDYEARCKRAGVPWKCPKCNGKGKVWRTPDLRRLHEEWKKEEPPKGDGHQLWETTSDGSPVSPVFSTLDALCEWCADNATTFGSAQATAAEWKAMLDRDFVCHREGNNVFI